MSEIGVSTHYVCAKGNSHWLSHVVDWESDQYYRDDGCYVHIKVEGGHLLHLTVFPDLSPDEAKQRGWYVQE